MKTSQIAVTMFTTRDFQLSESGVRQTLKRIHDIGYEAVQVARVGDIDYRGVRDMICDEGLVCCATHEQSKQILESPELIVERLQAIGCRYTAYPHPGDYDLRRMDNVRRLAEQLDHAGKVLRDAGLVLTYHNHDAEMFHIDGKPTLEHLYTLTSPEHLQAEIDTHWIAAGGGDPAEWCRRLSGRLPLLHLKDFSLDQNYKRRFAEVGHGNLNWEAVIPAAEESGCEWFIVEQDTDWIHGDPFMSIKASFEFLAGHFC